MKEIGILKYVHFGRKMNYLRFVKEGRLYHKLNSVKMNLGRFLKNIEELNLLVTLKTNYYSKLKDFKSNLDNTPKDYRLTLKDTKILENLVNSIWEVIRAELGGKNVYTITEKRLRVEFLINNIKQLFAPDVFDNLPDLSRFDFKEAGKCISFARSTAGAYHILRGMEGVLRWFYDQLNNSAGCRDLWGTITSNLKNMVNPPPNEIIDQSDAIRKNYRNPTAHPELIYDINEVQDLLTECIAVANRIINYLKKIGLL